MYVSATNTRGMGTGNLYLVGTPERSVRPGHNTQNLRKFCKTLTGTPVSSVGRSFQYPEDL